MSTRTTKLQIGTAAVFTLRSLLFVPADADRKVTKALASQADIVILDLEDSVAPGAKDTARRNTCEVLRTARRPLAVRINASDTPWHLQDLAAVGRLNPGVVMLPKCASASDVNRLSDQLDVLELSAGVERGVVAILPLVTETAAALGALDYRGSSGRLCGLAFAGEDLAADLGVKARDAIGLNPLLTHARNAVAIAATAAGVPAIDTPFPALRDGPGLAQEAAEAARLGFSGKLCIHPDQIDAVHAAFYPDDAAVRWSEAVIAAFASSPTQGVIQIDGKMIDRAHLRLAERRLSSARPETTV